jgi:hypothetical protein
MMRFCYVTPLAKSGGGVATYEPTATNNSKTDGRQGAAVTHTLATGEGRQDPEVRGGCATQ